MRNHSRAVTVAVVVFLMPCAVSDAQTRYPAERDHSPITRQVALRLKGIVSNGLTQGKSEKRFIKVGDSISASPSYFMGQFTSPDYDPAIHQSWDDTRDLDRFEYLRSGVDHFLSEVISGGETSFDRTSLATEVGQTASWAVSGNPSPLQQEIDAVSPMFAVIMFGTNDIGWWNDDHLVMSWIIENLAQIVDECIAGGIVPVLTAPPLKVGYELKTLTLSHLVRALAQARQIPFVNYHRVMMPLPDHGLGGDGVHPSVYQWNWMCHFTPTGLLYGTNAHNLITMQAFDRALRTAVMGVPALDFEPDGLSGAGTQGSPLQIDGIPFIDVRATTDTVSEWIYSFSIAQDREMRLMTVYQGTTDLDLTLRDATFGLVAADDGLIDVSLSAGQYFLVVETRAGLSDNAGEFQVLLMDRLSTGMPYSHGIFIDGAAATPLDIECSQPTSVDFEVTALDDGAITAVTLDLSEVGGASAVAMSANGDGFFSHTEVLTVGVPGEKLVTVTAQDDTGHQVSIPLYVFVGGPLFVDGFETADFSAWSSHIE